MAIKLVVKHPFATYAIGDCIADPVLVAKFSATHPAFVVKTLIQESEVSPPPSPIQSASPPSMTVPTLQTIR